MIVQCSEALVNEHDVQIDRGLAFPDLIRHAKRQRKRRHKRLAARKCPDFALFPGYIGIDEKIQPVISACSRFRKIDHAQLKLSGRHFRKPCVRASQNSLQISSLHEGFYIHAGTGLLTAQPLI